MPIIEILRPDSRDIKAMNYSLSSIDLTLLAWADKNGIFSLYSPTNSPVFVTNKKTIDLYIHLVSSNKSDKTPRFSIHSISEPGASSIEKILFSTGTQAVPGQWHEAPNGLVVFPEKISQIKLVISPPDRGKCYFYLTAIDTVKKRLITCDPQVENGTKTSGGGR